MADCSVMDTQPRAFEVDAALCLNGLTAVGIVPLGGQGARYRVDITDLLSDSQSARRDSTAAELYGLLLAVAHHYGTPLVVRTDCKSALGYFECLRRGRPIRSMRDATAQGTGLAELARRAAGEYPIHIEWRPRKSVRAADSVARGKRHHRNHRLSVWQFLATSPACATPQLLPALAERYSLLPLHIESIRARMADDPGAPRPAVSRENAARRTCI
jgi:hypothetical protein